MDKEEEISQKEINQWIKANKQTLNQMFSGTLVTEKSIEKYRKTVKEYFKVIEEIWEELPERYPFEHSTLQNSIGNYFELLDWDYSFEVPFGDLDSSHRFDIMAQKGAKRIIVEVKPNITTRDLGQVLGYLFDVKKIFKKVRVFLGSDILNFNVIFGGGEITDIIVDNAKHGLGIIFADKEQAWLIPAEVLLI